MILERKIKLKLDNKILANVILSSVATLPSNKTAFFNPKDYLFRLISFNSKLKTSWGIHETTAIKIDGSVMLHSREDIVTSLADYLDEINGSSNLEFISSDPLTKAVLVYTKDYIDSLLDGTVPFGEVIQNYYSIWHTGKSGVEGPSGTRKTNELYGTFSKSEVEKLKEGYIPIAVAPKEMPAILQNLELILSVSALAEYMRVETAANPLGINVVGSRCWWIPKVVAKEYLEETNDLKVLSKRVLMKALTDAGLMGQAAKKDVREIKLSGLDVSQAEKFVNEQAKLKVISEDFRVKDAVGNRAKEAKVDLSTFKGISL